MRATVDRDRLLRAATDVCRAVPGKPGDPLYSWMQAEAPGDGSLVLTASDGELTLRRTLPGCAAQGEACRGLLDARRLLELLRLLPEGPVTIDTRPARAEMGWGDGSADLPFPDDGSLPAPARPEGGSFVTTSGELLRALSAVAYAIGDAPMSPVLDGVLLEFSGEGTEAVASDGRALAHTPVATAAGRTSGEGRPVLPSRACAALMRVLPDTDGELTADCGGEEILLTFPAGEPDGEGRAPDVMEASVRLRTGKYPAWGGVLPRENPRAVAVGRTPLLGALRRAATVSGRPDVTLRPGDGTLEVTSADAAGGAGLRETLEAACEAGEPVTLGADALAGTLRAMGCETAELRLMDARRPVLAHPAGAEDGGAPFEAALIPRYAAKGR